MKHKIDMTTGPIFRNVLLFAIPIIIGNILQQLYTTVDSLVVGNFCGTTSLAAMGTSSQPVEVLLCVFLGMGAAVSVLVSQYAGAGDKEGLKKLIHTAIFFVYIAGIPIAIGGFFLMPHILKLMGTPADTWEAAVAYTRIVMIGAIGNIGYNMNAGILRGMGDSRSSLWFLMVSCVINILLDILLVAVLGMDVSGAALATILAMFFSWLVSIVYIQKKFPELDFGFFPSRWDKKEFRRILTIGIPMGLNNSLFAFGHMALQTLINAEGAAFMAGVSIAGRVLGLANVSITAIASAAVTYSGQNYGAGNVERLKKGHVWIPFMTGTITLVMAFLVIGIRMPILRFFSKEEAVLYYANRYVVVMLFGQTMYGVFNSISSYVNGVGLVKYTTMVNFMVLWVVRIPIAYLIARFFDGTWIMIACAMSDAFGMIMMIFYYACSKKWKSVLNGERIQA